MTIYRRPDPIPLPQSAPMAKARIAPVRAEVEDLNHLAARQIFLAIVSQTWNATGYLPKEDELGNDLGVSRTVLREAVKTLSSKSVVETRRRRGTAILDQAQWNLLDSQILTWLKGTEFLPDLATSILNLLAVTLPELAFQCTQDKATRAYNAETLLVHAKQMNPVLRFQLFHNYLAQTGKNPFVISVVSKAVACLCQDHPQNLHNLASEPEHYTAICSHIGSGDAEAASAAVRKIFQKVKVAEFA